MIRVNFHTGNQAGGGALALSPVVLVYWTGSGDLPAVYPAARVGWDFVFRAAHEPAPLGKVDFYFGADKGGGEEQGIFAAGFAAGETGAVDVRNFLTFAGVSGWVSGGFGRAGLINLNQWVRGRGWYGGGWGYPSIRSTKRSVFVREVRGRGGVGVLRIENLLKFVFTGNLYPPALPKGAMVDFAIRHLRPDGMASLQVGKAAVTGFLRSLETRGIAPPVMDRWHWVSRSPRMVDADERGIEPPEIRRPRVGVAQTVQPFGFEATLWLARIVPAPQQVYTQAWSADELFNGWAVFGAVRVRNGRDFVYALGHHSHTAEDLRFGWAKVELMRRYVVQIHDEYGGLTVQPWSRWQAVFNCNREVRHHSVSPAALPMPLVFNAARVIEPVGFAGGVPQVLQVTHGVRRVFPEPLEPVPLSRWTALHLDARVLGVFGMGVGRDAVPLPAVFNTRRYYRWIGGVDSAVWGVPFVDFARREVLPYPSRDLQPQTVPLPDVALGRRYVSVKGVDAGGFGVAVLGIRFNRILPRFARRVVFGWADVWNATPELRPHGADAPDFGVAKVWLYRRFVVQAADGGFDGFGRAWVADTRRTLGVAGFVAGRVGVRTKVWHLTTPDNYSRVVYPVPAAWGAGGHFGRPRINTTVLYPRGIAPPRLGEPTVVSFAIWVEQGIGSDWVGKPDVSLFHRVVDLAQNGFGGHGTGKPDLSPRTIWCRFDAPAQAVSNHQGVWQAVDGQARYHKQVGLGEPSVRLAGDGAVRPRGADTAVFGVGEVSLRRRYLLPKTWFAGRMGWVTVGDGRQWIELFDSDDFAVFGAARVGFVPLPDNTVAGRGWLSSQAGAGHDVSLWVRTLAPKGITAGGMGYSRSDARMYMPQSLYVGFPMPVQVQGTDTAAIGVADVSYLHRSVAAVGFDAFLSGYEPHYFGGRMRVWGTRPANVAPPVAVARRVEAVGFDSGAAGVPQDVSWRVRYIRPDGYMGNYRKGVSSV